MEKNSYVAWNFVLFKETKLVIFYFCNFEMISFKCTYTELLLNLKILVVGKCAVRALCLSQYCMSIEIFLNIASSSCHAHTIFLLIGE